MLATVRIFKHFDVPAAIVLSLGESHASVPEAASWPWRLPALDPGLVAELDCAVKDTTFVPACTNKVSTLSGDGPTLGLDLEEGLSNLEGRVLTRRTPRWWFAKRPALSGVDGDSDAIVSRYGLSGARHVCVNGSGTRRCVW